MDVSHESLIAGVDPEDGDPLPEGNEPISRAKNDLTGDFLFSAVPLPTKAFFFKKKKALVGNLVFQHFGLTAWVTQA